MLSSCADLLRSAFYQKFSTVSHPSFDLLQINALSLLPPISRRRREAVNGKLRHVSDWIVKYTRRCLLKLESRKHKQQRYTELPFVSYIVIMISLFQKTKDSGIRALKTNTKSNCMLATLTDAALFFRGCGYILGCN